MKQDLSDIIKNLCYFVKNLIYFEHISLSGLSFVRQLDQKISSFLFTAKAFPIPGHTKSIEQISRLNYNAYTKVVES